MLDLKKIWEKDTNWDKVSKVPLSIPEYTGGVNPGDQRAIYHLIKNLDVRNVLEIGTHIGGSLVSIALAMKDRDGAKITTVDIADVNTDSPCPRDLIHEIGCESFVDFVVSDSVEFLKNESHYLPKSKYDFIFLDGDHSYEKVYEELPLAYDLLADNGYILFHDYFPNYKPLLKSSLNVLEGPYRAVSQRLDEGLKLNVQPCGELPNNWKTKFPNECNTSLAIGMKQNDDSEKVVSNILIPYKTKTTTQSYKTFEWNK